MTVICCLYLVALMAEVAGLVLGVIDISRRARKIKEFSLPDVPSLPMAFNALPAVAKLLVTQGPEKVLQDQRKVNNELINALREQMNYSSAVDSELGKLAGIGDKTGLIWASACLIMIGSILGGVANLLATHRVS